MSKPVQLISYCISNVDSKTLACLQLCGYDLYEDHCLQRCGECYEGPFLLLGEKLLTGQSHEAILDAIARDAEAS